MSELATTASPPIGATPAGEDLPARALVPTSRELAHGAQLVTDWSRPLAESEAEPAPPAAALMREGLRSFDPRLIEGSKRPLAVFAAIGLIGAWDTSALSTLAPNIQDTYHLKTALIINLVLFLAVLVLFLGPFVGYYVDRVRRLRLVIAGLALAAVARIASALPLVGLFWGARSGVGVSSALTTPPSYPLMADYYPTQVRARTFSLLFLSAAIGTVAGPPLSAGVASLAGWRSVFVVIGVLTALTTVAALRLREPIRGALDRLETNPAAASEVEALAPSWAESWRAALQINTLRRLWFAVVFLVAGSAEVNAIILPLYYKQQFHLGTADRGYILAGTGIAGLLGLLVSGPVADRLLADRPARLLTLFAFVFFGQAGAYAIIYAAPSLWLTIALALPIAFVSALLTPGLVILISLVVPARFRGLGIQTLNWFFLVGLLLFAVLYDGFLHQAGLRALFLWFAPLVAVGGVGLLGASGGLAKDMRSALASGAADAESRRAHEAGRDKMLVCRDLDVSYDGVQVLFGVDFDVDAGEIVALVGTNGAGKSTLLCTIAGITGLSTGAVFLDGQDVTHVPADEKARRGVVMLPGGKAIFPTLSVAENLRTAQWLTPEDSAGVEAVYAMFPILRERRGELAGNLSGGEQQMLAVGQAVLMKPRLLLIDELSLGLAPAIVAQLLDTLRALAKTGTTMVLVEQSINVALTIAERAVFMEKGEVRFDGPTAELLNRPDLMRAVFMGNTASARGQLSGTPAARPAAQHLGPVLSVAGVSARFGGIRALADVDLSADAGEIVGLIGPNGAGKTTLMDAVSGLVRLESGSVRITGHDVTRAPAHVRARLGLARSFQDVRLFPSMTVEETLAIAMERHFGMRSAALAAAWAPNVRRTERLIARRVERLIPLLGLEPYADKFVNELSTGTRRMVDIGCVMASEPKVLLLDEPASGLAQAETEELAPILLRMVRETGCAAVVVEHDMPLITAISDKLVAMNLGRVLVAGSVMEVIDHPEVVRSYLSAQDDVIVRSGETAESVFRNIEKKGESSAAIPA
ncbi:MAG: MFS transporter [Mycobacteriales bacterium]